jgi:hypothetical protein
MSAETCPACGAEGLCEHGERLLRAIGYAHVDTLIPPTAVQATLTYQPAGSDADPLDRWCAEVALSESEPEIQGWGADPLGAAMALAEAAFHRLACERAAALSGEVSL